MVFTISDDTPAQWEKTLQHGQRSKTRLTLGALPNLTGWTIQAAISDVEGTSKILDASVSAQNNEVTIHFTLDQIKSLAPGSYLADVTALSPSQDPTVLLRGIWTILGGAVY
jgi:hypothetical protein